MKVDVLPGPTGLDEASWNSLLDRSAAPSAFLTWTWQTEWARAFAPHHAAADPRRPGGRRQPRRAPAALRGRARAAAHPRRRRRLRLSRPDRPRGQRGRRLADPACSIAPCSGSSGISTPSARPRRPQILPRLAPSSGLRAVAEIEERCPVLALPATWDGYLATLSGKDRHELKRKARKLERELAAPACAPTQAPRDGTRRWDGSSPSTGSPRSARRASWTSAWSASSATSPSRSRAGAGRGCGFSNPEGVPVASFLCMEHGGASGSTIRASIPPTRAWRRASCCSPT